MNSNPNRKKVNLRIALGIAAGALGLGLLFARVIYPELIWLTAAIGVPLVAALAGLIIQNRDALRSRTAAFGINSAITVVLVIAIVGVLNFLASRYPAKLDLTQNKLHTLSDQTAKVIRGLEKPVKAVYFAKIGQKEQVRPFLENLKSLNPRFEIEYVDPDKEPTRARQIGIKKYGTLQLIAGPRESKIEEVTEEKLTNTLIKLLKEKSQTLCALTGHGEKSFNSKEADGYDAARQSLLDQSFEVKEINLLQEGAVPASCDAITILGPTKAFFPQEIKAIQDYLANGGRATIALDVNIKGSEFVPELLPVLEQWYVKPQVALIVDPVSRMLGVDAAVPLLKSFSKDNVITKDFQGECIFPFARPMDIKEGAPSGLNVQWLAQTLPSSWAEADLRELASGQVSRNEDRDKGGPLTTAVAIEGKQKDSKAQKNTRIVVFGSSAFATNNYSRFGGNLDFFLNSVSWTLEDENFISIRAKEEGPGKVELTQKEGSFIFLMTVIVIPLLIAVAGVVIWAVRRRM